MMGRITIPHYLNLGLMMILDVYWYKRRKHSILAMVIAILFLFTILLTFESSGHADEYQDQVSKSSPGFQILSKSEFTTDIQKTVKNDPALIIGNFNQDKFNDFAALIRDRSKKHYSYEKHSYDYYDGKLVICHGLGKGKYRCKELSSMLITLPHELYLYLAKPGKIGCYQDDGTRKYIDVKIDSIGWEYPDKAAGQYIYQPDGSYLNCVTAD